MNGRPPKKTWMRVCVGAVALLMIAGCMALPFIR